MVLLLRIMKLVVGLGNPGKKYEHTRHNAGFDVIDFLGDVLGIDVDRVAFDGVYGYKKIKKLNDEVVILFKPLTFMNLSGKAVREIKDYFKIELEDIIVVYDDMDTDVGKVRVRFQGSSGNHHGIEDVINKLGTEKINRVRVGIGRPEFHNNVDFVLTKPKNEEEKLAFEEGKHTAKDAVLLFLSSGIEASMSKYN